MTDSSFIVILCTTGSLEEASKISEHLVREHLAACVNIVPEVHSIYWWNNQVQQDHEFLMLIKTEQSKFQDVESAIQSLHSYQVPEVIALPIERGSNGYLQWLKDSLHR